MRSADLLAALRRRASKFGVRHEEREGKGSHVKVLHGDGRTIVPVHRGDLPAGTLSAILRQLGLSRADLED